MCLEYGREPERLTHINTGRTRRIGPSWSVTYSTLDCTSRWREERWLWETASTRLGAKTGSLASSAVYFVPVAYGFWSSVQNSALKQRILLFDSDWHINMTFTVDVSDSDIYTGDNTLVSTLQCNFMALTGLTDTKCLHVHDDCHTCHVSRVLGMHILRCWYERIV